MSINIYINNEYGDIFFPVLIDDIKKYPKSLIYKLYNDVKEKKTNKIILNCVCSLDGLYKIAYFLENDKWDNPNFGLGEFDLGENININMKTICNHLKLPSVHESDELNEYTNEDYGYEEDISE